MSDHDKHGARKTVWTDPNDFGEVQIHGESGIGIYFCGRVIVKTADEWHAAAKAAPSATVSIDRELASTHWDDCWRKHHGCAVAMIERLSAVTETAPIQSNGPHGE